AARGAAAGLRGPAPRAPLRERAPARRRAGPRRSARLVDRARGGNARARGPADLLRTLARAGHPALDKAHADLRGLAGLHSPQGETHRRGGDRAHGARAQVPAAAPVAAAPPLPARQGRQAAVSPALLLVASVLGLAILSMPVYAVARGGSRDADAETKGTRL